MIQLNNLNEDVLALLNRTYKTYPGDKTLEEWMLKCDSNEAFLFSQLNSEAETVYAGVVEIYDQGLNARFGSGVDYKWDLLEIYNFLKLVCVSSSKTKLRLTGRAGWKRKLQGLGFQMLDKYTCSDGRLAFIFEKEFNHTDTKGEYRDGW